MTKLTEARLEQLKAETAQCAPTDELPESYLGDSFAQPLPDGACLCCGERGTFTWGLCHGTGHCVTCGWPARLYHFVKDADGKEARVVRLLQYHPHGISLRKTA